MFWGKIYKAELVEAMDVASFIDPDQIQPVAIKDLPRAPIVYFLTNESEVLYIGAAANPECRFISHHILSKYPHLKIRPFCVPMDALLSLEALLIERFAPALNKTTPLSHTVTNNTPDDLKVCQVCRQPLRHNNKSGYCSKHAEYRPSRKTRKTAKYRG